MSSSNAKTNIDIKKFFDNEANNVLKRNFMGVYSSDLITKFLNFYKDNKKSITHSKFSTVTEKISQQHIGGSFLIFTQKKIFYHLIVFDLLALNTLL